MKLKYMHLTGKLTALDFERLTESQMKFAGSKWEQQSYRFDQEMNYEHKFIYWVENYASYVLASFYLADVGHDSLVSYDDGAEMFCFTTDYSGTWTD